MPAIHYETFKTRYHECDSFGYLKPSNYLRWMQEAAFEASAAVGYDFSQYNQLGQLWLVRETDIAYEYPLRYGDHVEIKTRVMDFRRFRSRRDYQFRNLESGQLCAQATTDWVYLDSKTFRPTVIPEKMQSAFFPEGLPRGKKRNHPRKLPVPPEKPYTSRIMVGWSDLDMMWHVNNAFYLNYLEEVDASFCADRGWSLERMLAEGIRLRYRSHHLEYHQPARYAEVLEILAWDSEISTDLATRNYEIRKAEGGDLLVRAQSIWGFAQGDTGNACPMPTDF